MRQYIRNGWQKDYERYLLMQDEYGGVERYDQYLQVQYPHFLESQRRPPVFGIIKGQRKILVSEFARRCVKFNWYHPDAPKPAWFNRPKGNLRGFLKAYFYFPSPWDSVRSVKEDPHYHLFLDRWYREYKYFSAYSHILMDKLILQHFSQYKSKGSAEKQKIYGERKAEEFIIMSNTVAATLATLIVTRVSNSFGTIDQTREFWKSLHDFALPPKALWNIYPKHVL